MAIKAINLRKGMGVQYDGQICVIWSNEHVQKGKGPSYMQTELRNVETGTIYKNRFRPDETLEEVFFHRRKMEFLYRDGDKLVVMDQETYEQEEIPADLFGDRLVYLLENTEIEVASVDGRAIQADMPNTITLTVTDTPPQVKGATATNQLKEAICETGARIKVPPFVENGEQVNVDTRTGEYLGRA
jgi:elongation factor P